MRKVLPRIAGTSLSDVAELDTMVTVVDAGSILPVVTSLETLKDAGQEAGPQDERSLCDLMIDQVRGARRADWD